MAEMHQHLIARGSINRPIVDVAEAKAILIELVALIGMKLLDAYGEKDFVNPMACYCPVEGNRGLTAIALIETSSITAHFWDEGEPSVSFDCYSCAPFEADMVLAWMKEKFDATKIIWTMIDRDEKGIRLLNRDNTDCGDVYV